MLKRGQEAFLTDGFVARAVSLNLAGAGGADRETGVVPMAA